MCKIRYYPLGLIESGKKFTEFIHRNMAGRDVLFVEIDVVFQYVLLLEILSSPWCLFVTRIGREVDRVPKCQRSL